MMSPKAPRAFATRTSAAMLGVVLGLGLSSLLGLIWPWLVALVLAGLGLALNRRYPLLIWLALGVAAGGLGYLLLGWIVGLFGETSRGDGGT